MTPRRAAACGVALLAALAGCRGGDEASPPHAEDDGVKAPGSTPPKGGEEAAPTRRPPEPESRRRDAMDDEQRSAYVEEVIEGDAALYSGRFGEARGHYLRAMELRPDKMSPALGALRTMALRGHGEEQAAIEKRIRDKIEAYRAEPETEGAAHLLEARMAIALRKPGDALDKARLAVQRMPELGVAWRVLGEAELVNERWAAAVTAFRKAAELGLAAKSGTWERMADALDELGNLEEAERAARRAVELTHGDPHASRRRLNLLGIIVKHRGRLDEAAEILGRAEALGPEDPAVLHNLAALAEARGEQEAALRLYDEALAQAPSPMSSWRKGHLLLDLDRRQQALEAFTKAAAHMDRWTWPTSTRWRPAYDVGRLYAKADRGEAAIGWFEDAMREARSADATREIRNWLAFVRSQEGLGADADGNAGD